MTDPKPVNPAEDRSAAACKYIDEAIKGLTTLNTAVCLKTEGDKGPPDKKLTKANIEAWIAVKKNTNAFLEGAIVSETKVGDVYEITVGDKTFTLLSTAGTIEDQADIIAAALDPASTTEKPTKMKGGRRGKRSARRSKSRKGGRRSRKGGKKSRGCKGNKGRRSRGRTIKGGAKMSKELKAWMKRQKKATGITAISKKTIDAAKTTSQATGSEQRSDSSKHVAAKQRNF